MSRTNSILLICSIIFSVPTLKAQEFSTTLYVSDQLGNIDSVTIGYDPEAIDGLDIDYGAINMADSLRNVLDIRVGLGNLENWVPFWNEETTTVKDIAFYESKIEIVPKECLSLIPVSNALGFSAFINVFIKPQSYPIKVHWDSEMFSSDCVSASLISDIPIGGWFDFPCCYSEHSKVFFAEREEMTFTKHVGPVILDQQQDTILLLSLILRDVLNSNSNDVFQETNPIIYPNPNDGTFFIPEKAKEIKLYDLNGNSIEFLQHDNEIMIKEHGLFILNYTIDSRRYSTKVLTF